MRYHQKKYIVDSLNRNFKYGFVDQHLKIYDLENNEVEYLEILEFLKENFELDFKESMSLIVRWYQGDVYADYVERNIMNDIMEEFN